MGCGQLWKGQVTETVEAFSVCDDHLEAIIEDAEREVLAQLAVEIGELLGVDVAAQVEPERERPQWEEMVRAMGMPGGEGDEVGEPADPAVARLLPPVSQDEEIAREYRELTQAGLRQEKTDRIAKFWQHLLPENGPLLRLSIEEAEEFMATLTDIRLVLGERVGINSSRDLDSLRLQVAIGELDDHRAGLLQISDALAWWQESLIAGLQMLTDPR